MTGEKKTNKKTRKEILEKNIFDIGKRDVHCFSQGL